MAGKSERPMVSKMEIIAQLDGARWQLSRECRGLGDDISERLSVKGQLHSVKDRLEDQFQKSLRTQPVTWGFAALGAGFFVTRLLFRKKSGAIVEKASYRKKRSSLFPSMGGVALKTLLLTFEPTIAKVLKEQISASPKPETPHV